MKTRLIAAAALAAAVASAGAPGCRREPAPPANPPPAAGVDFRETAALSIVKGLRYLEKCQVQPGSGDWGDPGVSALVISTFFSSPEKITPATHEFIWRGLDKLASFQKRDGAIFLNGNATYVTSISLLAFVLSADGKYSENVRKAQQYLLDSQVFEAGNKFSGGFGYEERKDKAGGPYADIVNTEYAMEALHVSGVAKDNPVWAKAADFLTRCQHSSERNPAPWVDTSGKYAGGFVYFPGDSKAGEYKTPDGKTVLLPYGSVTYAGIKSMIYANLTKDDPRVLAAVDWIKRNWTLDVNPGFDTSRDLKLGKQGLFYYFVSFAKALHALGRDFVTDDKGTAHNWREELVNQVAALQAGDGSWKNTWHDRWWENMPPLATSYAVTAMSFALRR